MSKDSNKIINSGQNHNHNHNQNQHASLKPSVPKSGKIDYTFTNDYMFRAVLQSNELVLRGLIGSLLHLTQEEIISIHIKNPIILGEALDDKTFILDLLILLNDNITINLEMQVNNEFNWTDRSLSYLCRNYDQLHQGQEYAQAQPVIHIGILNYDLFPDAPEFYASYMMLNTKTHKIFNDKFTLNVLSLHQIYLATEEDKLWQLDTWARLFQSTTWEEIKMIAEQNPALTSAIESLSQYNSDETIRWQCRNREEYDRHERTMKKMIQDKEQALKEAKSELNNTKDELSNAQRKIAELENLLKEKQ